MTSRWVSEIQPYRDLDVKWKPFSLEIKNTGIDVPAQYRPGMRLGLRALRVIEAAKADNIADNDSIGRFYEAIGTQIHNQGLGAKASIEEALTHAKWPSELHYQENEESHDVAIRNSMEEAIKVSNTDNVGTPLLVIENTNPAAFFGPIITPTPRGEDALKMWDAFVVLASSKNFFEVKKLQNREPEFS